MSSAFETLPTATTTAIPSDLTPAPPITNYILGFLLIGLAWGFTTPFIRAAARRHKPPKHEYLENLRRRGEIGTVGLKDTIRIKVVEGFFGVTDLLRNWRYALPLVVNLTGSVWFFLLIGQAGTYPFPLPPPLILPHFSCPFILHMPFPLPCLTLEDTRLTKARAESHSAYYEFPSISVYGAWGLVCGGEGY